MTSPHPAQTIEKVRMIQSRFVVADLFESEAEWFATMAKTKPSNGEKSEADMETYVANMKPMLVWLDAVRELMIERGIHNLIDETIWEAVMAGREDLVKGEAALASWKQARETAARKAEEDAKRAAQETAARKAEKDAKRATEKGKMRENVTSSATRRRLTGPAIEGDAASGDDPDVPMLVNKKRKLCQPGDDEGGRFLNILQGKRGSRRPKARTLFAASPGDHEKVTVIDTASTVVGENIIDGGIDDPNSLAWTCSDYPKACRHPTQSWIGERTCGRCQNAGLECLGTGCTACQACARSKVTCSHSTWRTAVDGSTSRSSGKKQANPVAGRGRSGALRSVMKMPQGTRSSSLVTKVLPSIVSAEFQDNELRELQTQLSVVDVRLQHHVHGVYESANAIQSIIMAFGATIMRREAEEAERAALSEALSCTD